MTVPTGPTLLNAVTIEFEFRSTEPPVGSATLFDMNVTLPVVSQLRLVKVCCWIAWTELRRC